MALSAGSLLGPYEILSPIGAGGMGEVYRARDTRLGRDVAVKVLPPGFAADADRLRRFEREARTVGGLSHPNLVSLFDVGTHEGGPYLVMELLEGESLREKLTGKPIPVKRAVEIARGVAEGLSVAHDRGVVHRDLKPENIFLTKEGRVKVLDFGLARTTEKADKADKADKSGATDETSAPTASRQTDPGTVLGTLGYMSPEQVRGEPLDERSDFFSLGIVLWEMLTGKRPFGGATAVESMHAILKDDPPELDPALKVPAVLDRIVHTCLAKDPAARFHSAHDLAFALAHLPGSSTSATGTVSPFPKAGRWRPWGTVAAAAVALAVGIFLGHRLSRPRPIRVERLTSSPRIFSSARFLPDGRSVVYTAVPDGAIARRLGELYRHAPGELPVPLGVRDCRVLDVSASGELILVWNREVDVGDRKERKAVLARMPAAGGTAPRVVEEDGVTISTSAHWTRDGRDLVVKYNPYKGKATQAFVYGGRVLYEVPWGFSTVGDFDLNQKGDAILFREGRGGSVSFVTVGLDGRLIARVPETGEWETGEFVLFRDRLVSTSSGRGRQDPFQLARLSPLGVFEKVLRILPSGVEAWDVNSTGDLLVQPSSSDLFRDVRWREPGAERDGIVDLAPSLTWPHLNASGSQLSTSSWTGRILPRVFLRTAGQSSAADLGEGVALDQSPNGKTLLVMAVGPDGFYRLRLQPTGAGAARELPGEWIGPWGAFLLPGGKVFLSGRRKDDPEDLPYVLDAETGTARSPGWRLASGVNGPSSPDGRLAFGSDSPVGYERPLRFAWSLVDLESGARVPLPPPCAGMAPGGWTAEGKGVWMVRPVRKERDFPMEIWRCDLETGGAEKVHEIPGPDSPVAQVNSFTGIRVTPDGRSWAYNYLYSIPSRKDLFVVSGLL